ncbi:MAG TPA: hypothetical protein VJP77_01885 [Planctomycetota bacterium]|nr:hypothetical protein [Planctomycetota bacterium]
MAVAPLALVLALLLGVGLLAFGWLLREETAPAGQASAPAPLSQDAAVALEGERVPPGAPREAEQVVAPAEVRAADPRPQDSKDTYGPSPFPLIVAEQGVPIDPSRWATIGPLTRTPVPDSVFDEKYPAGTTLGTLRGTAAEFEMEVLTAMRDMSSELLEAGQFEEVVLPRGEDGSVEFSFYLGTGGGSSLPKFGYWSALDGGVAPYKVVWYRFDQHPEFYDKLDEVNYLRQRYNREK